VPGDKVLAVVLIVKFTGDGVTVAVPVEGETVNQLGTPVMAKSALPSGVES
jgi:hypothetical protein